MFFIFIIEKKKGFINEKGLYEFSDYEIERGKLQENHFKIEP
jgi:hypothetical protein